MESINVNVEFLFELKDENEWVNTIPKRLPNKTRAGETLLWVDKNNNVFELGLDFMEATKHSTYPCRVYRTISVSAWSKNI